MQLRVEAPWRLRERHIIEPGLIFHLGIDEADAVAKSCPVEIDPASKDRITEGSGSAEVRSSEACVWPELHALEKDAPSEVCFFEKNAINKGRVDEIGIGFEDRAIEPSIDLEGSAVEGGT